MAYLQGNYPILKKKMLADNVFDYWVACPPLAGQAVAGQFVHIRVPGFTLRRPISICEIDPVAGTIRLVFEVRGAGTKALALLQEQDNIDLLGPLGNGFPPLSPDKHLVVVGGGIGVPPLLGVAACSKVSTTAILGFRNASAVILTEDFQRMGCDTRLATDDGSAGYHGYVTGLLEQRLAEDRPVDLICACGPMAMLKQVVKQAQANQIPVQVSLEEHMGCGVGACLVCACKTVKDGREIFSHVCKDGPVFDGAEVVFHG